MMTISGGRNAWGAGGTELLSEMRKRPISQMRQPPIVTFNFHYGSQVPNSICVSISIFYSAGIAFINYLRRQKEGGLRLLPFSSFRWSRGLLVEILSF